MSTINLDSFKTLMGWNQLITIDDTNSPNGIFSVNQTHLNDFVMRCTDYEIGVRQVIEAPDLITGRQDRTAWRKGPIESDGTLSFPFTLPSIGAGAAAGSALFIGGVNLARYPNDNFTIRSSAHPSISGCKVNQATISCEAGAEIQCTAQVWGVVDAEELADIHSYGNDGRITWGSADSTITTIGGEERYGGEPSGVSADLASGHALITEQIPMWDICTVTGAPTGMFVVGFSIQVENNLLRNYTMGDGQVGETLRSPWGLNPTAISAGQRKISGTVKWQSDKDGHIAQILGAGIEKLVITIGPWQFTLNKVAWAANPPRLSVGERVTVESNFQALGSGEVDFDALLIEQVPFP